jgi:hypothetical protein
MADADGRNETPLLGLAASSSFSVWQRVLLGRRILHCSRPSHSHAERHAALEPFTSRQEQRFVTPVVQVS